MHSLRSDFKALAIVAMVLFISAGFALADTNIYDVPLSSPGCYTGTGCDNQHFATSEDGYLQIGLGNVQRFIGANAPSPAGTNLFQVAPGGDLAHPTWSTWGVPWSANTRNGGGTDVLLTYIFAMTNKNVTAGITGPTFDPVRLTPDNSYYGASGEVMVQDLANQYGAQNTINLGFTGVLPGFDPNAEALYETTFSAYLADPNAVGGVGRQVASVTIYTQVGAAVPEPGSVVLLGTTLFGVAFMLRRRLQK